MDKVIFEVIASASSEDGSKEVLHEKCKVRTKKKKRKRDVTELHQRFLKAKEVLRTNRLSLEPGQSSFTKVLKRFAEKREEYDKKVKGNVQNKRKICNRLLARPLVGIYRNGATGKNIRRNPIKLSQNDSNHARLQGDLYKLLQGYESKSEKSVDKPINNEIRKDYSEDYPLKTVSQSAPNDDKPSPILGKVDGKKLYAKSKHTEGNIGSQNVANLSHNSPKKFPSISSKKVQSNPINLYEKLCTVVSENFKETEFLQKFGSDYISEKKKKIRNIYLNTFRSQFLNNAAKHGIALSEELEPTVPFGEIDLVSTQIEYPTPGSDKNAKCTSLSVKKENQKKLLIDSGYIEDNPNRPISMQEKHLKVKSNLPNTHNLIATNYILNSSLFTRSTKKTDEIIVEEENFPELRKYSHTSLEVNHDSDDETRADNDNDENHRDNLLSRFLQDVRRKQEKNESSSLESPYFSTLGADLPKDIYNKKRVHKNRKQRCTNPVSLCNKALNDHVRNMNFKATEKSKVLNFKHVPSILRRCNNASVVDKIERINPIDKVLGKEDFLFSRHDTVPEMRVNSRNLEAENAQSKILNDRTRHLKQQFFVEQSPFVSSNLINDTLFTAPQTLDTFANVFVRSKKEPKLSLSNLEFAYPQAQKTMLFTKKEIMANDEENDSDACQARKQGGLSHNEILTRKNCTTHQYDRIQATDGNCYRQFHCSQNSANSNHVNRECVDEGEGLLREKLCAKKPVICEKLLLDGRARQSHENNQNSNQRVCFVVVDQGQQQSSENRHYICQEDLNNVGVINGVQNLRIIALKEQSGQSNFEVDDNQHVGSTVIFNDTKQPVKYLAVESNSRSQRVPIYTQNHNHVDSLENVTLVHSKGNYRNSSCSQEPVQKLMVIPKYEQNRIVYVKSENLNNSNMAYDGGYSHPAQVVLCQPEFVSNIRRREDPSNLCEVHVPRRNVVGTRKPETIAYDLKSGENMKILRTKTDWDDQCRSNYGTSMHIEIPVVPRCRLVLSKSNEDVSKFFAATTDNEDKREYDL